MVVSMILGVDFHFFEISSKHTSRTPITIPALSLASVLQLRTFELSKNIRFLIFSNFLKIRNPLISYRFLQYIYRKMMKNDFYQNLFLQFFSPRSGDHFEYNFPRRKPIFKSEIVYLIILKSPKL